MTPWIFLLGRRIFLELETRKAEWDKEFLRLVHRPVDAPALEPRPSELVDQMALAWVKIEMAYLYTQVQGQRGQLPKGEPIVIADMSGLQRCISAYQAMLDNVLEGKVTK